MKKILKKAVSSLIAMAMAASSFAATVIPDGAAAMLTSGNSKKYYDDLPSAVGAAQENDTITLLDDVTLTSALDIANSKNITIDGGNKTITTSARIEYKAGGTLTLKDLTITGDGYLNIPGNNLINADNLNVNKLNNIGGAGSASKGTISNSVINTMTLYGNITLSNTRVADVVLKSVKATGSDQPKINADSSSAITKLSANEVVFEDGLTFPYALMIGDFKAIGTATLPEGYEYNSTTGEIQVKNNQEATPEIAIDYANEKLTGFVADGSYTIGGSPVTPTETVQMATAVVTIGPIVLLYPFLQKYFVQGLTVGSVKG